MGRVRVKAFLVVQGIFIVAALFFYACGDESMPPDGSTIEFDPIEHKQTGIGADTPVNFTIAVRYPDGTPMPGAKVYISGPFAVQRNIPVDMARYQFYLKPDGYRDITNFPIDAGFYVFTDDTGVYRFSVVLFAEVPAGTPNVFSDYISAQAGTTYGSANVAID